MARTPQPLAQPIETKPAPAATQKQACRIDFSVTCPHCQVTMQPIHSHYQCTRCGWRDSCCF